MRVAATSTTFRLFGSARELTVLPELSANDGVHAVAYDAVIITVTSGINVSLTLAGTNVNLSWTGGSPPCRKSGSVL